MIENVKVALIASCTSSQEDDKSINQCRLQTQTVLNRLKNADLKGALTNDTEAIITALLHFVQPLMWKILLTEDPLSTLMVLMLMLIFNSNIVML